MREVEGSETTLECDLCLLAMGFVHPEVHDGFAVAGAPLETDARGNVAAALEDFATSAPDVFACGDARRGQSLVVWAIWEGREAARAVDAHLMGVSSLPSSPRAA